MLTRTTVALLPKGTDKKELDFPGLGGVQLSYSWEAKSHTVVSTSHPRYQSFGTDSRVLPWALLCR